MVRFEFVSLWSARPHRRGSPRRGARNCRATDWKDGQTTAAPFARRRGDTPIIQPSGSTRHWRMARCRIPKCTRPAEGAGWPTNIHQTPPGEPSPRTEDL